MRTSMGPGKGMQWLEERFILTQLFHNLVIVHARDEVLVKRSLYKTAAVLLYWILYEKLPSSSFPSLTI